MRSILCQLAPFGSAALLVCPLVLVACGGGSSGDGADGDALGTIQFEEPALDATEGSIVNILVNRSGDSSGVASVDYATSDVTAIAGSDYTAAIGTLTWPDGVSGNRTISIPITDDTSEELAESFTVALSNVSGATLGTNSSAIVDIIDNDVSDLVCGEIITENTTLQADLVCPGDAPVAIEFGAPSIILDLNGHFIIGQAVVGGNVTRGVVATDKDGITIRNGTIEGFGEQVFLSRSHRSTVSNMIFKDPHARGGVGINLLHCQELVVEDSLFELPVTDLPDVEVGAIRSWGGFTSVRNIDVINGATGVAFGFPEFCDTAESASNGEVLNSRFAGAYLSSIYVNCSTSVRVAGNDIATAALHGAGIAGDGPFFGAVTGLTVEDNTVHESGLGIEFRGVSDSTVARNQVTDSGGWGIAMRESLGCEEPSPGLECFYSTANLISDNVTLGNAPDLYHDAGSTGNTWSNNTCMTKEGIDIPEC